MSTETPDHPRLAKAIARAGLASRRDAERMIAEGRVTVNGQIADSPARNVGPRDRVAVDGAPLPQAEGARVWLYHKPAGLVTTERDEKDRETVFDALRDRLGRVLSVGRLDLTSEGLLLLTNDGDLKRRLELPETGWLRRYRVRVNGAPDEGALQRLRDGIEIDGERFGEMQVALDRQKGANAWLTVGLREGRNREVRRAAEAVGLVVNRLIRVSYGPFQLGKLPAGEIEEVKPRVLRDQLGAVWDGEFAEARRGAAPRHAGDRLMDKGRGRPGAKAPRGDGPRKGPGVRADRAGARPDKPRTGKPPVSRNDGKALGQGRGGDDRPRDGERPRRDGKPFAAGPKDGRKGGGPRRAEGGKPRGDKPFGARGRGGDGTGEGPARGRLSKPRGEKPFGDRKREDGHTGDGPRRGPGFKPRGDGPSESRKREDGSTRDRPKRTPGPKPRDGQPGPERPARDGDAPRLTKTQRKAAMRADTSVSLRKGGQRGRGISKPKPTPGKPFTRPTKPKP